MCVRGEQKKKKKLIIIDALNQKITLGNFYGCRSDFIGGNPRNNNVMTCEI